MLLCFHLQIITAQPNFSSSDKQTIYSDETLFISTNASTFVTGETLYYKINCLKLSNKMPSSVSKIAYIELVGNDKKSVFKSKVYLENAIGQGDYFVPSTIKSGNYKLIAYTNWMLNQEVTPFFQMDIFIINPFQASEKEEALVSTTDTIVNKSFEIEKHNTSQYLKLALNKQTFSTRERVNMNLVSLNEIAKNANYTISVRKLDDLPTIRQRTVEGFSKLFSKVEAVTMSNKLILPELRGEMITGKITNKSNPSEIKNITVGLSIPGKYFGFKVVKTDQNGVFIFNLDKTYYNATVNIQIIDEKRDNYTLMVNKNAAIDYSKLKFDTSLNLTPAITETLTNRSIASQIENAYYSNKADSIRPTKYTTAFYEPIAKEYILDDYERFASLKETTIEIVKEMYFDQKDKNYILHVRDMSIYTQSPEQALVLVDGLLVQNVNELFEYNMNNVYKISVIPGQYYLGPKSFNGVISFTTKTNDYASSQSGNYIVDTNLLTPSIKKEYFTPDYSDKVKNERIPDYRYQLLWMPQRILNQDENPITFYTSDITGTFEIKVEGFTDQGIPISLKDNFEVQ